MRFIVWLLRFIVGGLFMFSGLIKLNDPKGFAYKLEEYFSPMVLDIDFLIPYSLLISSTIIILEIFVALMLIVGYRKNLCLFILMLSILFFSFLTFYSAYYNKVTDCGCFGDAIKLTPWQSFYKDLILFGLITLLVVLKKYIHSSSSKIKGRVIVMAILVSGFFISYVLNHLPFIDFRPYKVGVNIIENTQVPEGVPKDIYEYSWKFFKANKDTVIVNEGAYPDIGGGWQYESVSTRLISKGYEPLIHDFTIEKDGIDFTTEIFRNNPRILIFVAYDLEKTKGWENLIALESLASKNNYKTIILTASPSHIFKEKKIDYAISSGFYNTDGKTLKTMIRGNIAVLVINNEIVVQKLNHSDFEHIIF